ncbi:zinc finger, CCHC-type containing protein [Tanacetum coccineum]
MAENTVKDMTTNFGKLDKFEGHDFRRWQKKMHFLLTTLKVGFCVTTPDVRILGKSKSGSDMALRAKWNNSKRAKTSDKWLRVKEVAGPSVNMAEEGKNKNNKQNKGKKRDFKEHGSGSSCNKKPKLECWKCGKTGHFKRDCRSGNKKNVNAGGSGKGSKDHSQDQGIIHETTAPYTPQQNDVAERKNRALKEMVNSMLSYSGLSEGFWGEAMAIVRLPDPKRKTLGEKGIDCIFVGYAKHSKAYRFYVIEPNESVSINSIIESRDAIFDENHFYSIPKPKDIITNSDESQRGDHSDDVPSEILEPRKGKKVRKAKSYGSDFQLYLVEGSRDQVGS